MQLLKAPALSGYAAGFTSIVSSSSCSTTGNKSLSSCSATAMQCLSLKLFSHMQCLLPKLPIHSLAEHQNDDMDDLQCARVFVWCSHQCSNALTSPHCLAPVYTCFANKIAWDNQIAGSIFLAKKKEDNFILVLATCSFPASRMIFVGKVYCPRSM